MTSKRVVLLAVVAVSLVLPFTGFGLLFSTASSTPVSLGAAAPFAVLANTGITNTGFTTITGDVGTAIAPESGFGTVTLIGTNYGVGSSTVTTAETDLSAAIVEADGYSPATILTALDGQTLVAGVYTSASGAFTLSGGVLTLNGQDNPDSVWIFQVPDGIAGALSTTGGSVVLENEAQACNVFWVTSAGGATIGTYTTFVGRIMAYTSVTLGTGTILNGAALASTGDVTMDGNTISVPTCATTSTTSTTSTTTSTPVPEFPFGLFAVFAITLPVFIFLVRVRRPSSK